MLSPNRLLQTLLLFQQRMRPGVRSVVALPVDAVAMSKTSCLPVTAAAFQEVMKAEATAAALRMFNNPHSSINPTGVSLNEAAKGMIDVVKAKGVYVSVSTCKTQIKKALGNNGKGVSPQKPGGVALPSSIEKKIAKIWSRTTFKEIPRLP